MPRKQITAHSIAPMLRVTSSSNLSLQAQLRTRIIEAIDKSILPPGRKLPSSRKLAEEIGVSRNTTSLAYQQLVAEGHLVAKERSGIYVADNLKLVPVKQAPVANIGSVDKSSIAKAKLLAHVGAASGFRCPPDWQKYRYPFIDGRYDRSLFPVAEWREASRFALGVREIDDWSIDNGDVDDELLIEEIRTKLLPRRGISAQPDEILVTAGEQQALHLLSELFLKPGVTLGIEEPGLPSMRALIALRGADQRHLNVDAHGMIAGKILAECDLVHVTPSRQRPTGVTLSAERRKALLSAAQEHDFLIIEDDFECEMNYLRSARPAMRAMEGGERVLYVAALSRLLSPGIRLGYLVGPADVIATARRLRALTTKRPSPNNQRTAAFFLSLGHYDAMLTRLNNICAERLIALRDALNHYRPETIAIPPVDGGTAYWVNGPEGLDAGQLIAAAEAQGILLEPVSDYFAHPADHQNVFRLGITSLPLENIRPGVELLSKIMTDLKANDAGQFALEQPKLEPESLQKIMPGTTLLYKTVYGEPCTIEVHKTGKLVGRAGYANEDRDQGEWWIEGDRWHRRWQKWAYGEEASFYIWVDGDALYWLNDDNRIVDKAIIVPAKESSL